MHNFFDRSKVFRSKYGYMRAELAEKLSLPRAGIKRGKWAYPHRRRRITRSVHRFLCRGGLSLTIRTDLLSGKEFLIILNLVEVFSEQRKKSTASK